MWFSMALLMLFEIGYYGRAKAEVIPATRIPACFTVRIRHNHQEVALSRRTSGRRMRGVP